ncbi:MAG: glycosyltransferase family 2 protein, partial [Gammaproteobacteria bacterium]|nr:glycosyltransferase family 2 protein [Gammaproteobacteria bacterium]
EGTERSVTASTETDHDLPGVSCLCLAYGRISVLEEAIESFLRQDYKGPKELIILNDLDAQRLIFDHPEVRIFNLKERFTTFGEKRQRSCELAKFDLLCHWDDDDIYLGHRLDLSIDLLGANDQFFKPTTAYFWNDGQITSIEKNLFHVQSCFRKELLVAVGGYPAINGAEDLEFEKKFAGRDGIRIIDIPPEQNYYFYRWAGVGVHVSGLDAVSTDGRDGYDLFDEDVRRGIAEGTVPGGDIELRPQWHHDYEQQAREFLKRSA